VSSNSQTTHAVSAVTVQSGKFASMPGACTPGSVYVATDVPTIQQLQVCQSGSYQSYLSLGGSGALAYENGTLDVVTSVLPRLGAGNTFTGTNTFANLKLQLSTAGCSMASDFGRLGLDNTDPQNTKLKVCAYVRGKLQWARSPLS
jgi:hypothetical protein